MRASTREITALENIFELNIEEVVNGIREEKGTDAENGDALSSYKARD